MSDLRMNSFLGTQVIEFDPSLNCKIFDTFKNN